MQLILCKVGDEDLVSFFNLSASSFPHTSQKCVLFATFVKTKSGAFNCGGLTLGHLFHWSTNLFMSILTVSCWNTVLPRCPCTPPECLLSLQRLQPVFICGTFLHPLTGHGTYDPTLHKNDIWDDSFSFSTDKLNPA